MPGLQSAIGAVYRPRRPKTITKVTGVSRPAAGSPRSTRCDNPGVIARLPDSSLIATWSLGTVGIMPLDLTSMYATHGAVRRELEHLARVTVRIDDDPRRVLRTASGWRTFKRTVRGHHRAEDEVLWPALRRQLADRPGDLVLLEAMEAEHAAIGQLIATIDQLLAGPEADPAHLGALTDSLVTGLNGHLAHEEQSVLPLVRHALTTSQWAAFARADSALPFASNRWNAP
jgi:hemerythrin-like domain-containing protein